MNITANYENILHLGVKDLDEVLGLRPSAVMEFEELRRLWSPFEKECERKSYDVFSAWATVSDVPVLARKLRWDLMWLTAMSSRLGFELPAFGPPSEQLHDALIETARTDMEVLREKNASYGQSWKRRGGIGAFMMLSRKWDRIDNILKEFNGATFLRQVRNNPGQVQDDIADLRRYLLLVEDEMDTRRATEPQSRGYLEQNGC